jgi:TolB-like protein/Tfp pilus assembly protein PilF
MGEESPKAASTPTGAVFLSYASQDAGAAQRICEALKAVGIEVWFDQSELRGGDAWDHHIRRQIADCALFVPVISAHSQARAEGYFRLEWDLADQRSHMIVRSKAFIIPVCVDDTPDRGAEVPESFLKVQWTRLPDGATATAFVERVSRLLSPEPAHAPATVGSPGLGASHTPGARREPTPSTAASRRSRLAPLLIAAVALMAVGYFALDKFVLSKRLVASLPAESAPRAIPEKSIAVLPFVNMSSDKEQDYFSEGLSEELIDLLAQVPDLRVPARTSSFYFKGKEATIAQIAKILRVANVLEGSVRESGNTIRVTAQLVRADDGYHIWSKTYERDLTDIFKVQDEIAGAVVQALKVQLASTPLASGSRGTSNIEAYNEFLLGRQFYDRSNPEAWRRAVEAYRQAIALDPHYAAAYAGLSTAEAALAGLTGDASGFKRAEAFADKAVTLAPNEADGYIARGRFRTAYSWDWTGAQADLNKALALDPGDSRAQHRYGQLLANYGRLPEAIAAMRKALDRDPLSSALWNHLGLYLMDSRDFAAAHEALRRALEIAPESFVSLNNLGTLQLLEGQAAEAQATFAKNVDESIRLYGTAMAEHTLGHPKESQQALDELIMKHAQDSADSIADVYAWRGEKNKAFEWLERAYAQHDGELADVKVDPLLDNLRGDPRYTAFLRKMKLPD